METAQRETDEQWRPELTAAGCRISSAARQLDTGAAGR